jgi:hypothetical protein
MKIKNLLYILIILLSFNLNLYSQVSENVDINNNIIEPTSKITEKTLELQNEFIKIIVNKGPIDQGRFSIETTAGAPENPNDDNKLLIYGRPIPWTSYTTIHIDGKAYIFGGINKKIVRRTGKKFLYGTVIYQDIVDDKLITECVFGDVRVKQILSFFRNPSTRVNDTALIAYEVINSDKKNHSVGIRVMLDTKLGSNDGAPFRIGDASVRTEKKFVGADIFDYWQTFDSLTSPNVIAQGSLNLEDDGIAPPDKMFLVNWGTLADNPWGFVYEEGRSFIRSGEFEKDTALALYWDPVSVTNGSKFQVKTLYGLGGISLAPGELSLGITAPADIYSSQRNEILIIGYVLNSGGFDSRNTVAKFILPTGFEVVDGKKEFEIGVLEAGDTKQIPIKVRLNNPKPGLKKIGFKVTSTTLDENEIFREINVLVPPTIKVELRVPSTKETFGGDYINADLVLTNNTKGTISDITTILSVGDELILPSFDVAKKDLIKIRPGDTKIINWKIKTKKASKYRNQVSALISTAVTKPMKLEKRVALNEPKSELYIKPSEIKIRPGDFVYFEVGLQNAKPFTDMALSLMYDNKLIEYVRTSEEPLFINKNKHNIETQKGRVIISNISYQDTAPNLKIYKIHFKALKPGLGALILKKNSKTIKTLDIKIGE